MERWISCRLASRTSFFPERVSVSSPRAFDRVSVSLLKVSQSLFRIFSLFWRKFSFLRRIPQAASVKRISLSRDASSSPSVILVAGIPSSSPQNRGYPRRPPSSSEQYCDAWISPWRSLGNSFCRISLPMTSRICVRRFSAPWLAAVLLFSKATRALSFSCLAASSFFCRSCSISSVTPSTISGGSCASFG